MQLIAQCVDAAFARFDRAEERMPVPEQAGPRLRSPSQTRILAKEA
jgi:hypothetical protein